MALRKEVEQVLGGVMVPHAMRSVMDLNLLRGIDTKDERMKITLSQAALSPDTREWLRTEMQTRLKDLNGIKTVAVDFDESRPVDVNQVDKVIAVMSGKGGVGKSLVTGLIALALSREGRRVAILDADVTGPSIARMFDITDRPSGSETGLIPLVSKTGIEIMSMNLLLPKEDDAVIWRGPLIAKSIKQFWEDVLWGKLDYLIVDLPPGTADVPLTVMQSLPVAGVVIVSTPQDLAAMVVRKAVRMAQQMKVPILGVVENMSYFLVPDTGQKIELFGKSRIGEMAKISGAPILGQLPIDPELAKLCDEGSIEAYDAEVFEEIRSALLRVV